MSTKLIVALDFDSISTALNFVETLNPTQCALKVGSEMFTLFGPSFVQTLVEKQFKVFLDLKFHDIPNTVARACRAACELGVWMVNVHAGGGVKMLDAAWNAVQAYGNSKPLLVAVTVLTSLDESALNALGIQHSLEKQVMQLANLTLQSSLDGVVCSALEVPIIKRHCGPDFLCVTPGIRLLNDAKEDQARVITPRQAIEAGSDYIVMGRSITRASQPNAIIQQIVSNTI